MTKDIFKMKTCSLVSVVVAVFFSCLAQLAQSEGNFCGTKAPDTDKTCVSVRLPWQVEPIYFCTDKANMKYRNPLSSPHAMHCGNQWANSVLLVATPWDVCPLASIPDPCVQVTCPPAPFNRTDCVEIPPPENSAYDCCPKYMCGPKTESTSASMDCRFQQLEPSCTQPPKDKKNCVGFMDSHGCCTKFQCDEDAKPGMCPIQIAAQKYSANGKPMMYGHGHGMDMGPPSPGMNDNMNMNTNMTTETQMMKQRQRREAIAPEPGNNNMPAGSSSYTSYMTVNRDYQTKTSASLLVDPHPPIHGGSSSYVAYPSHSGHMTCVGDFNCPTTLKCCSMDMSVYSDGSSLARNTHPTMGTCVEPIM